MSEADREYLDGVQEEVLWKHSRCFVEAQHGLWPCWAGCVLTPELV
jgi:hypothetical protein